jgi:sensor histidine kinase YesM
VEARLAEAQLQALRMQIQPHFLFNTLNSISVLVRCKEFETSDRMLSQLGDLLR